MQNLHFTLCYNKNNACNYFTQSEINSPKICIKFGALGSLLECVPFNLRSMDLSTIIIYGVHYVCQPLFQVLCKKGISLYHRMFHGWWGRKAEHIVSTVFLFLSISWKDNSKTMTHKFNVRIK